MKICITSELVEVKKTHEKISIRLNFHTASSFYGEISVRRNIRMAKFPTANFPYDEISIRRKFLVTKFPTPNEYKINKIWAVTETNVICVFHKW